MIDEPRTTIQRQLITVDELNRAKNRLIDAMREYNALKRIAQDEARRTDARR